MDVHIIKKNLYIVNKKNPVCFSKGKIVYFKSKQRFSSHITVLIVISGYLRHK